MAFLPKFADRQGYQDADIYQFERRRERPYNPTSSVTFGPSPLQQGGGNRGMFGPASRGMVDQVGQSGGNPTAGLLGIQNTTGFAQQAPNVIYDQQPEQFEKQRKLQERELGIKEMQAKGILENNAILNQTRMMNALSAQERAEVMRLKAENPNMLFQQTPDGIIALDPASGQAFNTGFATGKMGRAAEIGALQSGAMAQIGARNQGMMNVQGLRNEGQMSVARENNVAALQRLGYSRDTALQLEMLSQQGDLNIRHLIEQGLGSRQASQQEHERNTKIFEAEQGVYKTRNQATPVDRAWEQYNTNPIARQFIEFSEDGKHFRLKEPAEKEGFFGGLQGHDPNTPTGEQYRMMQQAIYGDETPNMSWPGGGNRGGTPSSTRPSTPDATAISPAPSGAFPSGAINQLTLRPEQMTGFSGLGLGSSQGSPGRQPGFAAAQGQYNAQPGQYAPPVAGQQPQQQGANQQINEQQRQAALAYLESKGLPQTEANIAHYVRQMATQQSTTTPGQLGAGVTFGAPAGTLTGPSAGTVRR